MLATLKALDWLKILHKAIVPCFVCMLLAGLYCAGVIHGKSVIQTQWNSAKLVQALADSELRGKILQKEQVHRQEIVSVSEQLRKTEALHDQAVSALAAEHAERLRASAGRSTLYWNLAEAGPAECRALASHTAEFDRALEQGIDLVDELQAALRQRDDQLRLVGQALISDRTLVGMN